MLRILTIAAVVVLVLHGLIHLLGTASYLRLAEIQGLPFKTTLLGGHWNLGESGIWIYGALWALAALGFWAAAAGWLAGWGGWQGLLVGVALFSLLLTALDWSTAFMGVIVNLAILAALWLGPRLVVAFAP
ncbi:MAG: ABC transporter permease [Gemmatimonadetes bacterium]|nr:ABC transporter permease [Gemmatimonadota bacterium]